jgi:hypothetical protein
MLPTQHLTHPRRRGLPVVASSILSYHMLPTTILVFKISQWWRSKLARRNKPRLLQHRCGELTLISSVYALRCRPSGGTTSRARAARAMARSWASLTSSRARRTATPAVSDARYASWDCQCCVGLHDIWLICPGATPLVCITSHGSTPLPASPISLPSRLIW